MDELESLSAKITREAERVEIEQTCHYIQEWVARRLGQRFKTIEVQVEYNLNLASYEVRTKLIEGRIYLFKRLVREEDIANFANTTERWARFMDSMCVEFEREFTKILIDDGVLPQVSRTDRGGGWSEVNVSVNTESMTKSLAAMRKAMEQLSTSARSVKMAGLTDRVNELEEAQAVASIKEAIAHQVKEQ